MRAIFGALSLVTMSASLRPVHFQSVRLSMRHRIGCADDHVIVVEGDDDVRDSDEELPQLLLVEDRNVYSAAGSHDVSP